VLSTYISHDKLPIRFLRSDLTLQVYNRAKTVTQ